MAKKVSNFSDLIQRVTASCLLHPLGSSRFPEIHMTPDHHLSNNHNSSLRFKNRHDFDDEDEDEDQTSPSSDEMYVDARETGENNGSMIKFNNNNSDSVERESEVSVIVEQVFEAVSAMKAAYGRLQAAHTPWDAEKMRVADEAVVAELRRMSVLRERYRRGGRGRRKGRAVERVAETVEEVVAPYEAVVEELKKEVRVREVELEELKSRVCVLSSAKKNGKNLSRKKSSSLVLSQVASSPTPEIFEATMSQVRETSKSFTSHLLSLMRSAHWDISAAVRSIEAAISTTGSTTLTTTSPHPHQPKHALESYILRKIFQGFDHETFYMDGTLSSLLNPSQFRQECFSKFRDMKSMDPNELLGILPNSPFGVFSTKKYQDIVHPKMEESLFGNLDQRNLLLRGAHPRTQFYSEFLGLAKSVWLLHLLAFSLDPPPSHFEASRGAEFHPDYMESVVRFPGGKVPPGQIVGFPVSPGFKLGNGSVVKARVYLVPKY
ncbi:hypothetical protein RND81_01G043700 [Saponaria officinalis]|uniref:DUF641 domain-containing protein n=1 Tax=Saponaria officinalis TaxID=3572 RepID=A0AAW1NCN3_SAPOF